jgi:4-hydroxybenzoyl-CoA thioesterase
MTSKLKNLLRIFDPGAFPTRELTGDNTIAATRSHMHRQRIAFGDCDPAQIVFYANYFKWFYSASLEFFRACAAPPWRELDAGTGVIGTPLVKASARFLAPASYGDDLDIETSIAEWRHKSFVMKYVFARQTMGHA